MRVTSIWIYPIKGARGIPLSAAEVRARGLAGDRRWVVVDAHGKFVSQRTHPQLALVHVELRPDGSLDVRAADLPALHVEVPTDTLRLSATVWDDTVTALSCGPEADAWFSRVLGQPCRLAHMDALARRPVAAPYGRGEEEVSFADAMPLLLACDSSLADLNRRLERPVPMSRFRPNLTVDGSSAWQEDDWRRLRIGDVPFEVTHPCARCVVTTIDQDTGEKDGDGEPLKTLSRFRRSEDGVLFGANLLPRGTGVIRLDDPVQIQ